MVRHSAESSLLFVLHIQELQKKESKKCLRIKVVIPQLFRGDCAPEIFKCTEIVPSQYQLHRELRQLSFEKLPLFYSSLYIIMYSHPTKFCMLIHPTPLHHSSVLAKVNAVFSKAFIFLDTFAQLKTCGCLFQFQKEFNRKQFPHNTPRFAVQCLVFFSSY